MNSLHKRLSLFKSPKLRRKLPIHNNDVPHSSTDISHTGAAYDLQAVSYPTHTQTNCYREDFTCQIRILRKGQQALCMAYNVSRISGLINEN